MASENVVHAKFKWQSNNSPNAIALRCDKHKLTYRQLDQYTNALAAQLIN